MLTVVPLYRLSIIPNVGNAVQFRIRPLARGYTEFSAGSPEIERYLLLRDRLRQNEGDHELYA